jgi:tRNA modification GTPase
VETIVARATPPGVGAIAVLRLSGPGVRGILGALGAGPVLLAPPRTATLVTLRSVTGELLDQGLVTFFPGPGSYTGEDLAELGVHGSPLGVARILDACVAAGARMAEPGEFTRRGYLAGKLDLVQVEAIDALLHARSPRAIAAAVDQIEGGFSRRIESLRQELLELEAHLAYHVDFPEEDEAPLSTAALSSRGRGVAGVLEAFVRAAPGGVRMVEGAKVVLAGPPNAGKSSLFNALLGQERAIVTEHPGTTRDAVEAVAVLDGFPFRLVDTAGIRDEPGVIEAVGIEVARQHLASADLVLLCVPADSELDSAALESLELGAPGAVLRVTTCADRVCRSGSVSAPVSGPGTGPGTAPCNGSSGAPLWIPVSSRTGEGLDRLQEALRTALFSGVGDGAAGDGSLVLKARQARALTEAHDALGAFVSALDGGVPAEFAAVHLRAAVEGLESVIGVVDVDGVLDVVFRSFCVGK